MKSLLLGHFVKNIIKLLTPDSFYNTNTCNRTHRRRLLYQKVIPRVSALLMVALYVVRYELKNGKVSFLAGVVSRLSRPHFILARGCGKAWCSVWLLLRFAGEARCDCSCGLKQKPNAYGVLVGSHNILVVTGSGMKLSSVSTNVAIVWKSFATRYACNAASVSSVSRSHQML